jgi:hypothetical protein
MRLMSSSASSSAPAAASSPHPCDVFLSHNSADDFAAAALEQRLARAGVRPWLAASQLISGQPWQEAMERALAQSETVAVIIGPQGMGPWHNEQMRIAIDDAVRQGKGVIPVLLPGADPERINPFLKRRTWVDFRGGLENEAAFQLLLAGIRGQAPFEAGDLFGLAWARRKDFYRHISYPPNYVPRPELLAEVRQALLADAGTLALTSAIKMDALHGMGGIGKSVMARALCDDPEVQAAFPDGILWATLGQTPELIDHLRDWIGALGGTVSDTAPTIDRLKAILASLLRERACLLIADDMWQRTDVETFCVGGPKCRLLFTTRNAAIARDLAAAVHPVPLMTPTEAVALLEEWAGAGLAQTSPDLKARIVRRLDRLPLAIRLAGAQLSDPDESPEQWLQSFEAVDLEAWEVETDLDSLVRTFAKSLNALAAADRRLYVALAVFKATEPIPVAGIARLWAALDQRSEKQRSKLLKYLAMRALLEYQRPEDGPDLSAVVRIHDLLRDFMAAELGDDGRIAAHRALLEAYRATQEGDSWHTAPDDGYLYNHLAYHLDAVVAYEPRAAEELRNLFADQSWMTVRVAQSKYLYNGYLADLELVWHSAHTEAKRQINADQEPRAIADCVRYALIRSSINSLSQNFPPALVARAVEVGLWPAVRAFSLAGRAPAAMTRLELWTALLNTEALSPDERQLASQQGLAAVHDMWAGDWAQNPGLLAAFVSHLKGEELVKGGLRAVLTHPFLDSQIEALVVLAPQLTEEERSDALQQVLTRLLRTPLCARFGGSGTTALRRGA